MALKRPPEHRADAPIIYIHPADTAWDMERIKSEQEEMVRRGEDPKHHPMVAYWNGDTRYDLDARAQLGESEVAPVDYLDMSEGPTKWTLKRLGYAEWYQVYPAYERAVWANERPWDACVTACRLGIRRVENGPDLEGPPNGTLTRKDLDALFSIGNQLIYDIGWAVCRASRELDEDEKKRSAS